MNKQALRGRDSCWDLISGTPFRTLPPLHPTSLDDGQTVSSSSAGMACLGGTWPSGCPTLPCSARHLVERSSLERLPVKHLTIVEFLGCWPLPSRPSKRVCGSVARPARHCALLRHPRRLPHVHPHLLMTGKSSHRRQPTCPALVAPGWAGRQLLTAMLAQGPSEPNASTSII